MYTIHVYIVSTITSTCHEGTRNIHCTCVLSTLKPVSSHFFLESYVVASMMHWEGRGGEGRGGEGQADEMKS